MTKKPTLTIEPGIDKVLRAGMSRDDAFNVLLILAQYLRKRKPVPAAVANHVAASIERAVRLPSRVTKTTARYGKTTSKPNKAREKELLRALGLSSTGRPPKAEPALIRAWMNLYTKTMGMSEYKATQRCIERFGVDEKTVRNALAEKDSHVSP